MYTFKIVSHSHFISIGFVMHRSTEQEIKTPPLIWYWFWKASFIL